MADRLDKKEWMRAEIEKLIRMYKATPELWDCTSKYYKDRTRRTNALREMAHELRTNVDEVQRKIHNLRNQFNTEFKKTGTAKSGPNSDERYVSRWPYYNSLRFLQIKPISKPARENSSVDGEIENDDSAHSGTQLSPAKPRAHISAFTTRPPKRFKKQNPLTKQNELLTLGCNFLSNLKNESKHEDDYYLNMAKVWARKLKEIEPTQRLYAEKAINDMLFDAQIRTLQAGSERTAPDDSSPVSPYDNFDHTQNEDTHHGHDDEPVREAELEEAETDIKPIMINSDDADNSVDL
ncbi:uncharacterized protein LOC129774656 [Toxorhynchites rutilus septentrionalis]|uniref:uncharacterized protein LOC129774656 n=1 Tax=Toxorhynchites rutilus septentrionalis TaxID=329112 RepID=UPI0024785C37|nr:uncharacterized protein LOC129774656 [Toxorhynchites rutilus septentrionalis]